MNKKDKEYQKIINSMDEGELLDYTSARLKQTIADVQKIRKKVEKTLTKIERHE
jgi:chromosome condensin MukBEF MukE localization factor